MRPLERDCNQTGMRFRHGVAKRSDEAHGYTRLPLQLHVLVEVDTIPESAVVYVSSCIGLGQPRQFVENSWHVVEKPQGPSTSRSHQRWAIPVLPGLERAPLPAASRCSLWCSTIAHHRKCVLCGLAPSKPCRASPPQVWRLTSEPRWRKEVSI